MATCEHVINAAPDRVYSVLADGWSYSNWIVGTSHVRAVDERWPDAGSVIYHASGLWPLVARDRTVCEEVEPGRALTLRAYGRWLGTARVRIELRAEGGATRVRMDEEPVSGPGHWLHNRLTDTLLAYRNEESLARLEAMVQRRREPADQSWRRRRR